MHFLEKIVPPAYLPAMAPQAYYRLWCVYLRGERLGEVLAATQQAACLRALHKFKIKDQDRRELEVRKVKGCSECDSSLMKNKAP
jgi:hypothetical protein